MYELISRVATALAAIPAIDSQLLLDVAELITDEDYQAHFLEHVASHFLKRSQRAEAERFIQKLTGLESSRILCRLAQTAFKVGNMGYAEELFSQALQATETNRFPTERGIAVLEIAEALKSCGLKSEALSAFSKAIDIAAPAQGERGTAGPEASSVILSSVQGLKELGELSLAKAKAELISVPSLKERAAQILEGSA